MLGTNFFKCIFIFVSTFFLQNSYCYEFTILSDQDIVGTLGKHLIKESDTFVKLARQYNLGFNELLMANPNIDPWLPEVGIEIILPTRFIIPSNIKREGIVINLPELRLYYFPENRPGVLVTHPISIGRMDWSTPIVNTSIYSKAENPTWYPPQSIIDERASQNRPIDRVIPPGPENPLGNHALRLMLPGYLIHGTNMPAGVGMRVTHGCIRMFPEDIERLYLDVPTGTLVQIINQPFKLGSIGNSHFLEAHPPLQDTIADTRGVMTELTKTYISIFSKGEVIFNWSYAEEIANISNGLPVKVN